MTFVNPLLAAASLLALLTACGAGGANEAAADGDAGADTASAADATHTTLPGHFACTSRQALDSLLRTVASGDSAAFGRMTAGGSRSCFPLKRDTPVEVLANGGPLAEIRAVGMSRSMWVPREAVRER